jgi:DNA excision repair protein ERCC-2
MATACPLARGFYDRLPAARQEAVALGWLDAAAQRQLALRHGICPYYLGQEMVRWADVLVGDVHHLFDPNGLLHGLMQALDWRWRCWSTRRTTWSSAHGRCTAPSCALAQLQAAVPTAPQAVRSALRPLAEATRPGADTDAPYAVLEPCPTPSCRRCRRPLVRCRSTSNQQPLAWARCWNFHFALQRFLRWWTP